MFNEEIVIGLSGFLVLALLFGGGRLWTAVIGGVLSWKYSDIALICMGCVLGGFLILEVMVRMRRPERPSDDDVIDAEFTVVSSDGRTDR
jgi:hypothetical protein